MELDKLVRYGTKRHDFIREAILRRKEFSEDKMEMRYKRWQKDEEAFLFYMPEREHDKARKHLRDVGGIPQYTTLKIPYDYAALMSAHTYWTSVFLARDPIFQYAGQTGQSQDATIAVESLINHQVTAGRIVPTIYVWLLDVGKYGVGILGDYWAEEKHVCSKIVEVPEEYLGIPLGTTKKELRQILVNGYVGNKTYNVRPYDFYPDPRVTMMDLQKGEFCARRCSVGYNELLKRKANGTYFNIEQVRKHRRSARLAEQGSSQVERPVQPGDETHLEAMDMSYIDLLEMYVEISPKAWGLGDSVYPEIWVFTLANEEVVIGAQPLGLYHAKFPFCVLESEPDGYSMFKRSLLEIAQPMTDIMTWLINTHFYNTRKALNDMWIVDPSRVVMKDVLDPNPGKIIRVREEFYGQDVATAIRNFPASNVTQAHMNDAESVSGMLQRITGVNDALMGMANQKGRQTATEIRTSSTFGVNRLKTMTEWFSATGFTDLSKMLVATSQELYTVPQKVRLAGDQWGFKGAQTALQVDPETIAGDWDFVPVDGTLPIDRFAQVNMWTQLLQQMSQSPQVLQTFDLGQLFAWLAQLGGLKNINQFKIEIDSPEALQQQAAAGNMVPVNGRSRNSEGQSESTPLPRQIPGAGPSG